MLEGKPDYAMSLKELAHTWHTISPLPPRPRISFGRASDTWPGPTPLRLGNNMCLSEQKEPPSHEGMDVIYVIQRKHKELGTTI